MKVVQAFASWPPRSPSPPGPLQAPVTAQAPLVIRMATFVPDGSSWHQILKETADKWKTASGGRVSVRLFPGGVAGDDQDVVRKMRAGQARSRRAHVGGGRGDRPFRATLSACP